MSFRPYVEHGWQLCAIDRGKKAPTYDRWNVRPIDEEIADGIDGAGLLHALSGTCALDVDSLSAARPWLAERGVDLDALLTAKDAVRIDSGRPGRAKLLYRLRKPLRTFKPAQSGLELRCATAAGDSVQDVLPPSVHPDTKKPYQWLYGEPLLGDWRELPPIPATLLAAWRGLLNDNPAPAAPAVRMDVELEKLHKWIEGRDPNMGYDDWLRVGMKLHHATGGAEEGLAIWDGWSARATRRDKRGQPVYAGEGTCRVHWVSFESTPGKVVATLDHELPADADEFAVVTPEEAAAPADPVAEAKTRQAAAEIRKNAIADLESRLVYVLASERYFDTVRHAVINSDSAIEHQFTSMMPRPKGGGPRMNPVKVLKQSKTKKVVEGLGFHPGEGAIFSADGESFANTYRNRSPEPLKPTKLELEKIEWIFARIEDATYIQWLKQYYAHVVQHPAIKLRSAPLLWSETQRNGKSTLLKTIPKLLVGHKFSQDVSYDMLNSGFNDYLQEGWHINLTEFRAGTRGERNMINNKLKAYIADDMVALHPKGGRGYTMPNYCFVTASSNEEDAAAVDNNDERWGVHEFKQPKFTEAERQWVYYEFLLLPRAAAVLRHYFLNVDLAGFHAAGSAPMTDSKRDMVAASLSNDVEMLQMMFEERAEFFERDVVLTSEAATHVQRTFKYMSAVRLGRILAKPPFNGVSKVYKNGEKTFRAMIFRNRKRWESATGREVMAYIMGDDDEIDIMD